MRLFVPAASASLALALLVSPASYATAQSSHAPTPPAILHAKTVFLSNESADSGLFPDIYSGSPDRGFENLYAALAASRHFEIVSDPAHADLVLALHLVAPVDVAAAKNGPRPEGFPRPLPLFRLKIYDRATHYVLWTLTEPIEPALLQHNNDKNFDEAVRQLTTDVLTLAGAAR